MNKNNYLLYNSNEKYKKAGIELHGDIVDIPGGLGTFSVFSICAEKALHIGQGTNLIVEQLDTPQILSRGSITADQLISSEIDKVIVIGDFKANSPLHVLGEFLVTGTVILHKGITCNSSFTSGPLRAFDTILVKNDMTITGESHTRSSITVGRNLRLDGPLECKSDLTVGSHIFGNQTLCVKGRILAGASKWFQADQDQSAGIIDAMKIDSPHPITADFVNIERENRLIYAA